MPELPAKRTPATPAELRTAMQAAAPDLTPHQQALLLAHISIETRNGQSIFQNNVGNISVFPEKTALSFWRPPWFDPGPDASERTLRLHEQMLAGKAPSAFAAYPSLAAGVAAYLSAMRGRFSPMLRADTPRQFVEEWRNTGYTPDLDVETTLPNFESLYAKFGGTAQGGGTLGGPLLVGAVAAGFLWVLKSRFG